VIPADSKLAERLRAHVDAEVLFDDFSRARYSTDASIYQIDPLGVVIPRTPEAAGAALDLACEAGTPILPRGAGTSQCGQTVGSALVIDNSKYLREIHSFDPLARTVWVEPGVVLDALNAWLKPYGLWFPVDVSTSAQATIGGMTANNSCGARSIRYGNMVHNVLAIEALLTSGDRIVLGQGGDNEGIKAQGLAAFLRRLYERERAEIHRHVPQVMRRVAGYNLDMAAGDDYNPASILVGSEGTLAYFSRIKLRLAPIPEAKVLGVVHFPTFYDAMNLTQDIVGLGPDAVELVDSTMIELARSNPAFRSTVDSVLRGDPEAILLVEFAGDDAAQQREKLARLNELMADLRLPGSVVDLLDPREQKALWNVRKAGLNIMMSMKGDGKPVSFIEDCAVPLEHLAEYTMRLTRVFEKHGTRGTWYAHASVGCLHVRPVLDMRTQEGADKMRAIAEEACALVREYKGSYSGEHGDGLVRSEWIERIYGPRLTHAFGEIKQAFDPRGLMNPGKIVSATAMDQRELFRFKPDYSTLRLDTALDWSEFEVGEHNVGRGFAAALEMCNNNGHCRKFDSGTMCPSFRVTRNERDLTRGRANTLRLAMAGQIGSAAITSEAMFETMSLCVSCKGCRRECPTGVDMARMKIEFLNQYHRQRPRTARDKLIAHLPRYAPWLARIAPIVNLRNSIPAIARLAETPTGISGRRRLPTWHFGAADRLRELIGRSARAEEGDREVVLLPDTFSVWFEPQNLVAAEHVLRSAGYRVVVAAARRGRPLCCGRTYLASGMVDEARAEALRTLDVLGPFARRGVPIVGIEPSCLFGFQDEIPNIVAGEDARAVAQQTMTFAQFIAAEMRAQRWPLEFSRSPFTRALVHGHCHEKAFDAFDDVLAVLRLIPGLDAQAVESSCCGMAGAFGYCEEHFDVSMSMAEASLLPAIRSAGVDTLIVADGTSCRHQIAEGAQRTAVHLAAVLSDNLSGALADE
jgi:FAD/FMN-containing dehydrogenase/Fe-S oxidoreductase